ncbi:MAG: DUF1801 domain-containing protein [Chloroflexi bacterium]|nr:DUF1801 domain-containing protein [Chloroflexota bacterium]
MPELHIKTVGGNGSFEDVIAQAPPEIQSLARAARALLADVMPGITEVPWARQKIAGYGVGPKKMSQHFCYIAPFKKHLNLGFMYGAHLPDLENLLEGKGADLRHVKIRKPADLERPALRVLIEEASRTLPKLK